MAEESDGWLSTGRMRILEDLEQHNGKIPGLDTAELEEIAYSLLIL